MPRTINRTPFTVDEPDIDYYFFNHNDWKGQCDDENFLTVDQQSFEETNNIYIDAEGILKTRPSIVNKTYSNLTNRKVIEVQSFDDLLVIKNLDTTSNKYYYNFYRNDIYKASGEITENAKILLYDNKLFIFTGLTNKPYSYYDLTQDLYKANASSCLYIPNTYVHTVNKTTEDESWNILTNSYKETYVYSSLGIPSTAIGKDLYYYINTNNDTTCITIPSYIDAYQRYIMSYKYSTTCYATVIPQDTTAYTAKLPLYSTSIKIPVSYADDGSLINCIMKEPTSNNNTSFEVVSLTYSFDGVHFSAIKNFPYGKTAKICLPKLSQDGTTVFAFLSDTSNTVGLYAITVGSEITGTAYTDWTLIKSINNATYASIDAISRTKFAFVVTVKSTYNDLYYYYRDGNDISSGVSKTNIQYQPQYRLYLCNNSKLFINNVIGGTNTLELNFSNISSSPFNTSTKTITIPAVDNKYQLFPEMIECNLRYDATADYPYTVHIPYIDNNYVCHLRKYGCKEGSYELTYMSDTEFFSVQSNNMYQMSYVDGVLYCCNYLVTGNLTNGFKFLSVSVTSSDTNDNFIDLNLLLPTVNIFGGTITNNDIVTNNLSTDEFINLYCIHTKSLNNIIPDHVSVLNRNVIAINNTTYIDSAREDEFTTKQLYFPKALSKSYNYKITALHPISTTQMAVFFNNEIWLIQASESTVTDTIYTNYLYTKSQVSVGVTNNSDVITSFDGKYTIFATQRGLVSMSYQDFIASTEQSLSYLSDNILTSFTEYCENSAIKLYMYKYWLICYKQNADTAYVMDMRNNSWWPVTYNEGLASICTFNYKPVLVSNNAIKMFDKDDTTCKDGNGNLIKWSLASQKLHFNYPNYHKHICNLNISAVNNTEKPISYLMTVVNYRNIANIDASDVIQYQVDIIRTYVKRLNYSKVNEFQYILYNSLSTPSRLSISNITIKYTITGFVR